MVGSLLFGTLLLLACLGMVGCSFSSGAFKAPEIDPAAVATAAIDLYDQNGDKHLTDDELTRSALSEAAWDSNKDGSISEEEIQQRFESYLQAGVGMIDVIGYVRIGNRPLEGAEVEFEPEEFLAGAIHPAYGTTDSEGGFVLAVAEENRQDPTFSAAQIGLYKVRITHPDFDIRAEFNTDTKLSYEVSPREELTPPVFSVRK